jgi:UDP-glucose:(heptosyl)LPS alpha-1,3-glucosyltransferase
MKLGLIYHQFTPAGGLEKYLIEFTQHLLRSGHEIHVLTSKIDPRLREALKVSWHEVARPSGSPLLRLWHFDRVAAREGRGLPVDLTIGFGRTTAHDLHRAGGGAHALYSRLLPWYKRWSPKNYLELLLEKRLYQGGNTRHFILNSARIMAQIQGLYPAAKERGTVIHTAVESALFKPAENRKTHRERVCEKLNTDPWRPVGLFVSLSHRRKGLDALLRAWKGLDATLWIAGKPLGAEWMQKIDSLGLTDRIRALPVTNDLTALYQAADWFLHPTLYDACANTVLQSMSSGLPGLISVQDGAVDHVRDGANGFLLRKPQDEQDLHERLQQAFSLDEDERAAMGQRARETMLPLTWEAHVNAWMRVIGEVRGES